MSPDRPVGITLPQFTAAFVFFAVLTVWALISPELGPALELGRTRLTIWASAILLIPALVLYLFRAVDQRVANLAHLFWTSAWLAFVIHGYWAVFVIFDGVADTFVRMGTLIAGVNFLLTVVWTLDVVLLWTLRRPPAWLWMLQWGVRAFTFLVFAITLVILRGGTVRILGIVFTGTIVAALLVRAWSHVRAEPAVVT